MPRQTLIQIRRGSESELVEANPTLSLGEMTYITDSNKLAIGNGTAPWQELFPWLRIDGGDIDNQ